MPFIEKFNVVVGDTTFVSVVVPPTHCIRIFPITILIFIKKNANSNRKFYGRHVGSGALLT